MTVLRKNPFASGCRGISARRSSFEESAAPFNQPWLIPPQQLQQRPMQLQIQPQQLFMNRHSQFTPQVPSPMMRPMLGPQHMSSMGPPQMSMGQQQILPQNPQPMQMMNNQQPRIRFHQPQHPQQQQQHHRQQHKQSQPQQQQMQQMLPQPMQAMQPMPLMQPMQIMPMPPMMQMMPMMSQPQPPNVQPVMRMGPMEADPMGSRRLQVDQSDRARNMFQ